MCIYMFSMFVGCIYIYIFIYNIYYMYYMYIGLLYVSVVLLAFVYTYMCFNRHADCSGRHGHRQRHRDASSSIGGMKVSLCGQHMVNPIANPTPWTKSDNSR